MPNPTADQKVVDEIKREISRIGDSHKEMVDSLKTDLEAVRKAAADGKTDLDADIIALKESVLAKQEAIEASLEEHKKRQDEVDTALKRRASDPGSQADEVKSAIEWERVRKSSNGEMKIGNEPTAERVNLDEFRAFNQGFKMYLRRDERALGDLELKLLQEGSDPAGGFWVPPSMDSRIRSRVFESSPMRQLASVITIGSDRYEAPYDDGEFSAGWVGETQGRPVTDNAETGMLSIPVHEVYAQPAATQRLVEDASIDLEGWIANKVADKFSRMENGAFVTGDGIAKPRGILSYPASGSSTGRGWIEQVGTGQNGTITADAIKSLPFSLKEPYMTSGANWLMNRLVVLAVMLLKDADGQYLWRPGLTEKQPQTLAGYPVSMAADMPVPAVGALVAAFGNFKEAYQIVDRLGISTLRDPYTAKPKILYYSRKRVGGDVVQHEALKLLKASA